LIDSFAGAGFFAVHSIAFFATRFEGVLETFLGSNCFE
jgi:hypothetical protein